LEAIKEGKAVYVDQSRNVVIAFISGGLSASCARRDIYKF